MRGVTIAVAILVGIVLAPSVIPFTRDVGDGERVCVAIRDGWRKAMARPSDADLLEVQRVVTSTSRPTPADLTPAYRRGATYILWLNDRGVCIVDGKARLRITFGVVAALAIALVVRTLLRHTRLVSAVRTY